MIMAKLTKEQFKLIKQELTTHGLSGKTYFATLSDKEREKLTKVLQNMDQK